ncbi:hypothetical protein COY28_06355 [Candidatus Woesearchaeota archaeon CG_4_10_14_0_2_um_filter_57_5]|nr:MAG: hypothetical protein AUJ68_05180 [Candidatus Woesearchaeota archaeon CG1_02_57_44]PIN69995.1 MAG: hypothetical protein COV94_02230 [Candidatus Woesearchaeota archaeon CG11_big_fil_rev_8_21_14_0_20_57_5]PIZ49429.1 MAG: hypothetical protein COY28_06355 [Candidatus Woesearchaeota archaeon CG_4_10_14_0_2_um_filter_57_5]
MTLLSAAAMGLVGGITRSCVGILKATRAKRKFSTDYYILTLVASAIVGATAGMLVGADYRLNILAGYAGTDVLEGLAKAYRKV